MMDTHNISQAQVARYFGVTDSAISFYRNNKRTYIDGFEKTKQYLDLKFEIEGGAIKLINGIDFQTIVCQICTNLRGSGLLELIQEEVARTSRNGRFPDRLVLIR